MTYPRLGAGWAILALCVAGCGSSQRGTQSGTHSSTRTSPASGGIATSPAGPTPTAPAPTPASPSAATPAAGRVAATAAVKVLVERYVAAFNSHDAGTMQSILSPAVRIAGPGAGYCLTARNRASALSGYRALFAFRTRSLTLRATVLRSTTALLVPARGARVDLALRLGSGGLQIARISSRCEAPATGPGRKAAPAPPPSVGANPSNFATSTVAHPAPGCTIVLAPTSRKVKPGAHKPSQSQLQALCRSARSLRRKP